MRRKNPDLHGQAPDACPVALLLVDWINALDFEGGAALLRHASPAAERAAELRTRAYAAGVPVIYANDNFGRWQASFERVVEWCTREEARGRPVANRLRPGEDDYFVLKPKHSAFFGTSLPTLLDYLGAETLVLSGIAGDICIFFTALDAYMRDFHLVIPQDATASECPDANAHMLRYAERVLGADTRRVAGVDFERVLTAASGERVAAR